MPKTRKVLVKHKLTKEDKSRLADEVSDLIRQKRIAEEDKKDSAAKFTAIIKGFDVEIVEKATVIHDGVEKRNVECYVVADYRSQRFFYHRVDNDELVKTVTMTQDEAQRKLPFPAENRDDVVGGELNMSDDEITDAVMDMGEAES